MKIALLQSQLDETKSELFNMTNLLTDAEDSVLGL